MVGVTRFVLYLWNLSASVLRKGSQAFSEIQSFGS
jgi:hypothetical protein